MNKDQLRGIIEHDYHQLSFSKEKFLDDTILAINIKEELEYYKEHPSAFNYAQFAVWINKLFRVSCEHDYADGIPGLGGNTLFICKKCGHNELDD